MREYRESSFALVMTRERKAISSLKIIEGNRNLDRRGSRSKLEKIRFRYPKMISRNERKGIVAVNPKGGRRRGRGREMFIESDILSPRSISFYERRVRSR